MTDYTKLTDGDSLHRECGLDAKKWAEAFCQLNPTANVDEDTMLGWFANVIMWTLDTERGTIHNGDHMQYLMDNNLPPYEPMASK